jgi:prevent-host-death family protein
MASISVYQARAELSRLIERALSGEEIIVTRRGKPTVRLVPVDSEQPRRKPGALKGKITIPESFFDPLPDDIIEAFYESKIFPDEE